MLIPRIHEKRQKRKIKNIEATGLQLFFNSLNMEIHVMIYLLLHKTMF